MNKIIKLKSQNLAFEELQKAITKKQNLILLLGKSGSGKTFLLRQLHEKHHFIFFEKPFFDEASLLSSLYKKAFQEDKKLDFQELCEVLQRANSTFVFLFDEVGMYEQHLIEKLRLLSDITNVCVVLSAHTRLKIFTQEYFASRISKQIQLFELDTEELLFYIREKFALNELKKKHSKWLLKLSSSNLRMIDKILESFIRLDEFYTLKNQSKSIFTKLEMSAIYHNVLGNYDRLRD